MAGLSLLALGDGWLTVFGSRLSVLHLNCARTLNSVKVTSLLILMCTKEREKIHLRFHTVSLLIPTMPFNVKTFPQKMIGNEGKNRAPIRDPERKSYGREVLSRRNFVR